VDRDTQIYQDPVFMPPPSAHDSLPCADGVSGSAVQLTVTAYSRTQFTFTWRLLRCATQPPPVGRAIRGASLSRNLRIARTVEPQRRQWTSDYLGPRKHAFRT
jgi:hypothetical protein